jgi:hypothetical protein
MPITGQSGSHSRTAKLPVARVRGGLGAPDGGMNPNVSPGRPLKASLFPSDATGDPQGSRVGQPGSSAQGRVWADRKVTNSPNRPQIQRSGQPEL